MARQQSRVTVRLREMILNGAFAPGERITESQIAAALDVSRTPVRLSLAALEHEGLVSGAPNRGFKVRSFSVQEINETIDVRGTLEGMAARLAAERGISGQTADRLRRCLTDGDALLAKGYVTKAEANDYEAMNVGFHGAIVEAAGNGALAHALSMNDRIPFAGAGAVAFQDAGIMFRQFDLGHRQHHTIFAALAAGEGTRAEALMREHAQVAKGSLNLLRLGDREAAAVPGLRLVRA